MPNRLQELLKVQSLLETAAENINHPRRKKSTSRALLDAHEIWCELDQYAHKGVVAKDIYDLYDNLSSYYSEYYDKNDEDSLDFLVEAVQKVNEFVYMEIEEARQESYDFDSGLDEEESSDSGDEKADRNKNEALKKEIANEIKSILDTTDLSEDYYGLEDKFTGKELSSTKWKTYIYLRKCVLAYRAGDHDSLNKLLIFLEKNTENKRWLAERLLDKTTHPADEKWGSGNHEWLERSLIVDVLKRSAGMMEDVQQEAEGIDWLYVQAQLRSPDKYLFFKIDSNAIRNGHPGAVKKDLAKKGFAAEGSPAFHDSLVKAFENSSTLASFTKRVHNIFILETISGKKHLNADNEQRFLVDGTETNDEKYVNAFRKTRLRPDGYTPTKLVISGLIAKTTRMGELEDTSPVKLVDSDISDDSDDESTLPDINKLNVSTDGDASDADHEDDEAKTSMVHSTPAKQAQRDASATTFFIPSNFTTPIRPSTLSLAQQNREPWPDEEKRPQLTTTQNLRELRNTK